MTAPAAGERRERMIAQLDEILRDVWADHPEGALPPDEPLRMLGVESAALITFLVTVEERLGISWGEDIPAGALGSLGAMADLVLSVTGADDGPAEVAHV